MTDIISTDMPFSPHQRRALAWLADQMIPGTDSLPGAGSPAVQQIALGYLANDEDVVASALLTLDRIMQAAGMRDIDGTSPQEASGIVSQLKADQGDFIQVFQRANIASYYQQDEVLVSLGMSPTPPFPDGHPVEPTDWSLLDPVRDRAPFYREPD